MTRALLRLHLDAFARGPAALLLATGVVFAVVFSRNGLDPRDVPGMLSPLSLGRVVTLSVVVALARTQSRALLFPPGAACARASAIPRATQLAVAGAAVLLVHLPVAIVFAAGGSPVEGVALVLALAGASVARSRSELALALLLGTLGAWALPVAAPLFLVTLRRAFRDAPVAPRARSLRLRGAPWPLHLAAAYVRAFRGGALRLALAALSPVLGLALVRVGLTGEARAERAVSLAATIAALGAAPLVSRVSAAMHAVRPTFRASAPGRWGRRAPVGIAIALISSPSLAFAAGTHGVAPGVEGTTLVCGVAVVALLVTLDLQLSARRRDAHSVWTLMLLPTLAVTTLLARHPWVLALLGVAAVSMREPEVQRAQDH